MPIVLILLYSTLCDWVSQLSPEIAEEKGLSQLSTNIPSILFHVIVFHSTVFTLIHQYCRHSILSKQNGMFGTRKAATMLMKSIQSTGLSSPLSWVVCNWPCHPGIYCFDALKWTSVSMLFVFTEPDLSHLDWLAVTQPTTGPPCFMMAIQQWQHWPLRV